MYFGLHVKYTIFLSDFHETGISRQIVEKKNTNIKIHENPSSGSQVTPCRRRDITTPTVSFGNFANDPKNL